MAEKFEDIYAIDIENKRRFEECKENYGSVTVKRSLDKTEVVYAVLGYSEMDLEIALVQHAYIDGPADGTPIYRAHGIDAEGNEYEVIWSVVEGWENIEDESEMCDWDKPKDVIRL